MPIPNIAWFRQDLRLADNPALTAAVQAGGPVIPLFILDEESPGVRPLGGASRWWLHGSLTALADDLASLGATLVLRRGPATDVIAAITAETGAAGVYWNRLYEPTAIERDKIIKARLTETGIEAQSFNAGLLWEPWNITTKAGSPYGVFTPFWKALLAKGEPAPPLPRPDRMPGHADAIASDRLADWRLLPTKPDWAGGLREMWTPGEAGAGDVFARFRDACIPAYPTARDIPGQPGTSRLSPHLHFGEIGPRQLWHAVRTWAQAQAEPEVDTGAMAFLRELGWREFNHHLLFHRPDLPTANVNAKFDAFPWQHEERALSAWQQGRTGYPIVDAGMRELWHTGWMHNRVRMITASFLVKHLLIDWRDGEAWFWDTLVDADLANNAANWQWVAGCGADAAPYFRIFNPIRQGERFDRDGAYVRRWVPELAALPDKYIHSPWTAPPEVLAQAGLRLGDTYPEPYVDHGHARQRALAAYEQVKRS
ncbi:MAG: DNA photolyase family protein [Alphaproteobacteria bacterium]|nr:DNA photolyase family protein [Alphaproteobacteria bacterium]